MYRRTFPKPRRYRDQNGDLWIDGEFFMGRNRVPPMPVRVGLTDRTTGVVKVLSHNGGGFVLADVNYPQMRDLHVYGPYAGPYSAGVWRLYLDNDTVAFERVTGNITYDSSRILTRNGYETTVLELTADNDGNVVYTQVEL